DTLMQNIDTLTSQPKDEHLAMSLTTGEQQTISYLSMVLNDIGVQTNAMTGYQAGIKTIGHHVKSKIAEIDAPRFEEAYKTNDILVVAGCQDANDKIEITTLASGGSDTSAVAIASSINTT